MYIWEDDDELDRYVTDSEKTLSDFLNDICTIDESLFDHIDTSLYGCLED